ncbi:hypothetical protein HO173_011712 [Letharia columbiana]|uniref:DUF1275 domain protein n=1 Tax=Letharia columbiana TaxID=112416 RepID=A0A8H6FHY9_9LECA|nr:uncharacterized protein HO173_011712 [Letharia columbiana]KAF6228693.1 hypothetical protein HO173_011712 [Letharia columbiana]
MTMPESHPQSNGSPDQRSDESVSTEEGRLRQKRPPASDRLRSHLRQEVNTDHADLIMLTCSFISGLVDSTIYNAYGTFVSMQTGNTIFVGLGPSTSRTTSKPYGWAKSLTSIVCFCLGCLFFSRLARYSGPLRRVTLVASFALQSVIIMVVAAIIQAGVVNGALDTINTDIMWKDEVPISLLSFQAAGQIIGSRALGVSEIPSVVLTSMLCDIASDPNIAAPLTSNVKRNRRALAFTCILVGAIVGGYIGQATGRMQFDLWIAGGIKVLITMAWFFWPEKRVELV